MFTIANWRWPQWVYVAMVLLGIGMSAAYSGQERKHDSFGAALVAKVVQVVILVCGGFYQTVGWPQVIWTALIASDIGFSYKNARQPYEVRLFDTLLGIAIAMFLLIMGGFFA